MPALRIADQLHAPLPQQLHRPDALYADHPADAPPALFSIALLEQLEGALAAGDSEALLASFPARQLRSLLFAPLLEGYSKRASILSRLRSAAVAKAGEGGVKLSGSKAETVQPPSSLRADLLFIPVQVSKGAAPAVRAAPGRELALNQAGIGNLAQGPFGQRSLAPAIHLASCLASRLFEHPARCLALVLKAGQSGAVGEADVFSAAHNLYGSEQLRALSALKALLWRAADSPALLDALLPLLAGEDGGLTSTGQTGADGGGLCICSVGRCGRLGRKARSERVSKGGRSERGSESRRRR